MDTFDELLGRLYMSKSTVTGAFGIVIGAPAHIIEPR